MLKTLWGYRRLLLVILDIFLIVLSYYMSFLLRFEGRIEPRFMISLLSTIIPVIIIRIFVFQFSGLYRGMWRYASINDLLNIVRATSISSGLIILFIVFTRGLEDYPRSVFIIDWLLITALTGGSRFSLRILREYKGKVKPQTGKKNVLIIGAGDAGYTVLREIRNNPKLNYSIKGFIDDDIKKHGSQIAGVEVIGSVEKIPEICERENIDEIIIAIPSAKSQQMKRIIDFCEKTKAKLKTVPSIGDLIDGKITFSQIREIEIEDLLGREPVEIDTINIAKYISGKKVLITGAGGSIGSEICRQVMKFNPAEIILFGRGEHSIWQIYWELTSKKTDIKISRVLGDVINRKKLEGVFGKYKPDIIFHAGADKHVPLLEENPDEAVLNNIIGTKNVIETAEKEGVSKVVCISTDKAADPVSVMGYSKRIAEIIVQKRNHPVTKTMAVRFGNVLGSRGSVVPVFKKQIEKGGPVTVTHPDMVRYFMTIREAALLVLQAGAIGKCGELFLLDMGSPVRIIDLARQMIRLSGFEPDTDIKIEITGLRKGEKLIETLTGKGEQLVRTEHPKILSIKNTSPLPDWTEKDFEQLIILSIEMDKDGIIHKLYNMLKK